MSQVKDIIVKVIPATIWNDFIRRHHYSWKVVPNSQLHFWCFLDWKLHWVMSYWPSINKKWTINLVKWTKWNEFIELNRMAFDEFLPRNSESRCIAISIRMIKKKAPRIKRIISFADWTQCWDWTIYRASWFKLVWIAENSAIRINPETWEKMHTIQAFHLKKQKEFKNRVPLKWNQLKYVYLIDKNCELNVPVLDFTEIDKVWAWMYKWEKITRKERHEKVDE